MPPLVRKIHWFSIDQVGFDPRRLVRLVFELPRYLRDLATFRRRYRGRLSIMPCLHDRRAASGSTRSEYFSQDLLVARMIFEAAPTRHLDIGSRIDGFVAHVASFRDVTVIDIRPPDAEIAHVEFIQLDLMSLPTDALGAYDSISCLHTLEHFGLGRYGDPIDPNGYVDGFRNMASLLSAGGTFYLSVPVGVERVEFNAHRVFDARHVVDLAGHNGLKSVDLHVVEPLGRVARWPMDDGSLADLAAVDYRLGIFRFVKDAS